MPATLVTLAALRESALSRLEKSHAAYLSEIVSASTKLTTQPDSEALTFSRPTSTNSPPEFSLEEILLVFQKLKELVTLSPAALDTNHRLYLEQQVSDLVGFPVTSELDGELLKPVVGTAYALPHLKRFPSDTLDRHTDLLAAGISSERSSFGWSVDTDGLTPDALTKEQYFISLPLFSHPQWSQQREKLREWYRFRKVLVLNPLEQSAVVGVVGDIFPLPPYKYQFGAAPAVIRETQLWSKPTGGKAVLLFVDDPNNQVPIGPVPL